VPEWYFLPFYAILRSIPNKLLGVVALLLSIMVLLVLPQIVKPLSRSLDFRPFSKAGFWSFVMIALILGWVGAKPAAYPFINVAQMVTFLYFSFLLILFPFLAWLEAKLWLDFLDKK